MTAQGIEFVSSEELRSTLRRHRIRAAGHISASDANAVRAASGANMVLVGSIDFFRDVENMECGLSLRLVSAENMEIMSAASYAATSRERVGLFGAGEIDSVGRLVTLVTEELVERLYTRWLQPDRSEPEHRDLQRVVVLPFENITDNRHAGSIAANWLLSELVGWGYAVVEPGAVIELILPHGGLPVGGIDYPRLELMRSQLTADFIVTGQVDRFRPARTNSPASRPEIEFGLRTVDAATGLIVAVYNDERNGAQSEWAFGLGRCHSLGLLLHGAFADAVDNLRSRLAEYALE
jgi:hypothetical protein